MFIVQALSNFHQFVSINLDQTKHIYSSTSLLYANPSFKASDALFSITASPRIIRSSHIQYLIKLNTNSMICEWFKVNFKILT